MAQARRGSHVIVAATAQDGHRSRREVVVQSESKLLYRGHRDFEEIDLITQINGAP